MNLQLTAAVLVESHIGGPPVQECEGECEGQGVDEKVILAPVWTRS